MAIFCSRYLVSSPLNHSVRDRIHDFAISGYYGFQDYAVACWYHHVGFVLNSILRLNYDVSEALMRSVDRLFENYEFCQQPERNLPDSQPEAAAKKLQRVLQE